MEIIPLETLLKELQEIDSRVTLIRNPNRPGLCNFTLNGRDICQAALESGLQTEWTPSYTYTFPNGMRANVATYDQLKSEAIRTLERLKNPDVEDAMFGDY